MQPKILQGLNALQSTISIHQNSVIMIIKKETIETLQKQGIIIRWFPENTFEEFKKNQWEREYKKWFDYSKSSCKELNPPKNDGSYESWNYDTLAEYEESIRKFCDQIIDRHCSPYEFDTLFVEHDGGQILVKKENVKSKEITVEYVLKLVEKDRKTYAGTYGKFAMEMQRICKELGYTTSLTVYPTTYGIGIWLFYNFHADAHIENVRKIMEEKGIEFYNEYSDKRWVYRFKVSKKRENLEKIFTKAAA